MRELTLSPAARRDLAEIAEYLTDAAGPTIAAEVVRRIRTRCDLLAETEGEIGTERPEIQPEIRSFPVPPHVLFFRYTRDEVQIVRILHERRDVDAISNE